jgi:hypothetical protein
MDWSLNSLACLPSNFVFFMVGRLKPGKAAMSSLSEACVAMGANAFSHTAADEV